MIRVPKKWEDVVRSLPETGMGYTVVMVTLEDGRQYERVVIDSGYIARVYGYGYEIPFDPNDIADIVVTHDKWDFSKEH
jgi:hypothetical protein